MLKPSTGNDTLNTKDYKMKNLLKSVYAFFCAMGQAKYAANLAYNHKVKEAQAVYKD